MSSSVSDSKTRIVLRSQRVKRFRASATTSRFGHHIRSKFPCTIDVEIIQNCPDKSIKDDNHLSKIKQDQVAVQPMAEKDTATRVYSGS